MNQSSTTTLHSANTDIHSTSWQTEAKFQQILTHLGQQALSGLSLTDLFQLTANLIGDVLNVDYSNIWQILSDRHSLQRVASYSLESDGLHPEICLIQSDTAEANLNDNQPILLDPQNARQSVNHFCLPVPADVVSGIQVPIPGLSKYLGIIEVHSISAREFSPDTIHFLQSVTHILSTAIERQQSEGLVQSQRQVLEDVATGNDLQDIFNNLCLLMEKLLPGSYCSILIVDPEQQCLKSGAAPTLPEDYAAGVDGLMIGQCAGSCGTAAYRGQAVFVTDIASDPLWAAFRDFALGHNIRACWSTPFFSRSQEVLGTFAISHRVPCHPTQYHRDVLNTAAHLASIATESYRTAETLKNLNQELERKVTERTVDLQNTLEKLKKTQAQLVQTEKMSSLGEMVAGIAHEINNPVGFIVGNLDCAEHYVQQLIDVIAHCQTQSSHLPQSIADQICEIDFDFIADDLPKLITSMQAGGERISNIVLGLRNFSRLDESEQKSVDIHDGLNNTLMLLNHRIVDQGAQPRIEIIKDYGNVPDVLCYPNQLNQVFMNLLSNAIDAVDSHREEQDTPQGDSTIASETINGTRTLFTPQIRIQTKLVGNDRLQIRIHDNGCGVDSSIQSRIFDPFFTTKPVGSGTGLGLSISYQIITERHGGILHCESRPEEGTTFVIELPIIILPND